jgi:hypothetical protein
MHLSSCSQGKFGCKLSDVVTGGIQAKPEVCQRESKVMIPIPFNGIKKKRLEVAIVDTDFS